MSVKGSGSPARLAASGNLLALERGSGSTALYCRLCRLILSDSLIDRGGEFASSSTRQPVCRGPLLQGILIVSTDANPTADGNVAEILALLVSPHPRGMGLGPSGVAPETRLKECFLQRADGKDTDYEPAMKSAIEQGWVERISTMVRLTAAGHKIGKIT
jgi:hypothetical protein